MKMIDRSPYLAMPERMSIFGRVQGSMKHGLGWPAEVEAQQNCIHALGKDIGDDYTLLQNVSLDDLEIPIPLVLVGPAGLFVMTVTTLFGSYRAKENNWLSLKNPRSPKPAQPNLLVRTCLMAQAVDVYLAKNGVLAPRAQPVLLCADPHMFVECIRSAARVIRSDSIDLFATNLASDNPVTSPQIAGEVVEAMTRPPAAATPLETKDNLARRPESRLKFNFSRGQWIALGAMVCLEVIALVVIIILILRSFIH